MGTTGTSCSLLKHPTLCWLPRRQKSGPKKIRTIDPSLGSGSWHSRLILIVSRNRTSKYLLTSKTLLYWPKIYFLITWNVQKQLWADFHIQRRAKFCTTPYILIWCWLTHKWCINSAEMLYTHWDGYIMSFERKNQPIGLKQMPQAHANKYRSWLMTHLKALICSHYIPVWFMPRK